VKTFSIQNLKLFTVFCIGTAVIKSPSPRDTSSFSTWIPTQLGDLHECRFQLFRATYRPQDNWAWILGMYWGMQKGTSWVKAMSYSEKIKPVDLAIIELCWLEGS